MTLFVILFTNHFMRTYKISGYLPTISGNDLLPIQELASFAVIAIYTALSIHIPTFSRFFFILSKKYLSFDYILSCPTGKYDFGTSIRLFSTTFDPV